MTVYVDSLRRWGYISYRGRRLGPCWCHMTADSLEELHAFALHIGMRREWFQNKSIPHYDLTSSRRVRAVQAGARETDHRKEGD